MELQDILQLNEAAIEKWINPPKLSGRMTLVDRLKLWHDTKRYFIVRELARQHASLGRLSPLKVLDFGSGHGGVTIDVATVLGPRIQMTGYDVSRKACDIASRAAQRCQASVHFLADPDCDIEQAVATPQDAIISCDVFGHVPSVPDTFKALRRCLVPGGKLIAFSETVTGSSLTIPTYLRNKGFRMDDSEEEHISLHTVRELKAFLEDAGFVNVQVFPYDPIRFLFYPKRYITKLRQVNKPLWLLALVLSVFQNRLTEIAYNQFNLWLAQRVSMKDTAGCLIVADVPH